MKHVILTNPYAGNKNNLKKAKIIQKLLDKKNIASEIIVSKYPKYFTKIASQMSQKEKCRFYCVGGDGTLNEIASGIVGCDSEIVLIPYGTGNDFIKITSKYKSMRKIISKSLKNDGTKTDILLFNKSNYSINILSIGFDAMVGNNINKFRWVPFISGKAKYNLSIIYTLFFNQNFKLKLRCDNEIFKGKFTLAAIANGKFYGGGICPCPEASVTDGKFNLCLVDETSIFTKLKLLPKYKKGNHLNLKQVHILKGEHLTIVSTRKFPINVDGEIYYTNKLSVKLLKKAVNIVNI
ncbi:MAG: YegS/Rv2252/BmrU family lipid kinase [Clostridia bacterium]